MTEPTPWTVVSHAADDSVPSVAVGHLMRWLADQPGVELHTVLWAAGPAGTERYDLGRFADAGKDHKRLLPRALRTVGLGRVGGGLAGRAVRSTLRDVPRSGVLYLSTARSGATLRYLPPGERTVITHLHQLDRTAPDPLAPDKVEALAAATDVWLASDEPTRDWACATFDLADRDVTIVAEPVDPSTWNRATRRSDPGRLRIGLAGAAWFRRDLSSRVAGVLRRLRPELELELVWMEVVGAPEHLAPLTHDLEHLGLGGVLELPRSAAEVISQLDDIDVLALTTPDDEAPWVADEAIRLGVPVVCFDTHRSRTGVERGVGVVVDYLDVVAMAEALLAIHDEDQLPQMERITSRREALRRHDVTHIGPTLLDLARQESGA